MNELDALKQKRLAEMQAQMNNQLQDELSVQQQIAQLEAILKNVFTKKAMERYYNLKSAYPEKAIQVVAYIGHMIQQGKIDTITDEQLKSLLQQLTPAKKEFKIRHL